MDNNIWASLHFRWEEVTRSSAAIRKHIDNSLPENLKPNVLIAAEGMEEIRSRALMNLPILIDSWYRCPVLNTEVGGQEHSGHMDGWCVDFICPSIGLPWQVAERIVTSGVVFDQLILEGTWVHIGFDPRLRREILTAQFIPGQKTKYLKGII